MDIESVGIGGGGGIIGAVISYFGFSKRLDTIEKKANDDKREMLARIIAVEEQALYKDVHGECSRSWHEALGSIDRKLDILITGKKP